MLEVASAFIIHFISQASYFGIFALTTAEAALIPIPSEITLTFSGFLTSKGILIFPLVIFVATLGELLGSTISYFIGKFLEEELLVNIIRKFGKFILVTEHDYQKARTWFDKYGDKVVLVGRLVPGVRTFISLPAGILEMNYWKFILYSAIGSIIWISVLVYFGSYLGEKWMSLEVYFRKFELGIIVLLIIAVIWYINHKLKIIKLGS